MFDTPIVVLAVTIVASVLLMVVQFRVHRVPSIVGVTFLTLLVLHGLSAIPFAMGVMNKDLYWVVPVSPDFPWVVAATFGCYAFGAAVCAAVLRFNLAERQREFFSQPLVPADFARLPYVLLAVAAVTASVYYAYGVGKTGLDMISESARDGAALREFRLGFREANPYYYVGNLAGQVFDPILMLIAMTQARAVKSVPWIATAVVLFLVSVLAATAQLHKAPIGTLLIYLLLCWMQSGDRFHRSSARFFLLTGVVLLGVGLVGYYFTYDIDSGEAWQATIDRIVLIPQGCLNGFLYVYPRLRAFDHGLGIGLIAKIVGVRDYVSPPFAVAEIVTGQPNTSANAVWSSEFWASFGYPGVLIGSTFVGALMVWLDWWCLTRKRTATAVAQYAFMVVTAIKVPSISIFTALLSVGLGLGPVFVWLFFERRSPWKRHGLPFAPARSASRA